MDPLARTNVVKDATTRFSCRVDLYVKHRPGYPPALIDFLADVCNLRPAHVVADVGSGSGALAEVFLRNGNAVYAIEPNPEMRAAAEHALRGYSRFRSVDAVGERTTLPERSVDLVAVGRAFHWLEPDTALAEFARILKPEGWVVIIAFRRNTASPFLAEYEKLLSSFRTDRGRMRQRRRALEQFLAANAFKTQTLPEERCLGREGLQGLTLSYSTSPAPDDPQAVSLLDAVDALFQKHQRGGEVLVGHDVTIYHKQLGLSDNR